MEVKQTVDIHELRAFEAVARLGSFSIAAESLHITQPAMSKRISTLEASLGLKLFDRLGRNVQLTEAGRALLPRSRRILAEVEECRRSLSNLQEVVSGRLSLGTSHHVGLHRLPSILRAYAATYPLVQLDLQFIDSEDAFAKIMQGDLEIGIITLPSSAPGRFAIQPIWQDELRFVVGNEHALANVEQVSIAELAAHNAVLPGENTFTRRIIERRFHDAGVSTHISLSTNYLETIRMMVSVGLGWSVLPSTMINEEVKVLCVEGPAPTRQLGLVYHTDHTLSNAAQAMIEMLALGKH
ncbi:Transcriptional regulator, LysR family [gamma proteobacterium HdN1]|nr:Transcriptional regulator, LysR family [gamma proteobacterium HdN1]